MIHYHTVSELAEKSGRTPYRVRKFARTRPSTIRAVSQTKFCITDEDFQLYLDQCRDEDARQQILSITPACRLDILKRLKARKVLLRADELASILNLPNATVLHLMAKQKLPHYTWGRIVRLDPGLVARWLEERPFARVRA